MRDSIGSLDVSRDIKEEKHIKKQIQEEIASANASEEDDPEISEKSSIDWIEWSTIGIMLLVLVSLTLVVRLETDDMPYFEQKAQSVVEQYYQSTIATQVGSEKTILPGERVAEAETRYQEQMKDPETIESIDKLAEQYKSVYRDEQGMNYLYGADAYYYFSQTRQLVEEGIEPRQNMPKFYAIWYKAISVFDESMTLKESLYWLPVLFAIISVLFLFLIGLKLTDRFGGFIAALFLVLTPSFLLNTRAGFIDTNALNIMLSMAIILFFLYVLDFNKKSIIAGILCILAILSFEAVWKGWFYILGLLCLFIGVMIVFYLIHIMMHGDRKRAIIWLSGVFTLVLLSMGLFSQTSYMGNLVDKFNLDTGFYPSGFITVAELQGYSIPELAGRLGGPVVAMIGLLCFLYLIYDIYKDYRHSKKMNVSLFVTLYRKKMFIGLYLITLIAIPLIAKRFTVYALPAFGLILGFGVSMLLPNVVRLIRSMHINVNALLLKNITLVLIALLMILSAQGALRENMKTIPHMNDAIYNTALEIKYNSSQDAMIDLWWDYGYLYEAIGEREVLFHGGSFDSPKLHWISKAFLAADENLSRGIIKMMNCRNEKKIVSELSKEMDSADAIYLLHEMLALDKDSASEYLKEKGLPTKIVEMTHCDAPESFLIAGSELKRKMLVLNYYANFDFRLSSDKIAIENMTLDQSISFFEKKYDLEGRDAERYYDKTISYNAKKIESVSFKSDAVACSGNSDTLVCGKQYIINMTSMDASVSGVRPPAFIYYDGSKVYRKEYSEPGYKHSLVLLKKGNNYESFLVNPEFDSSVLLSLLYFNGANLENFNLFHIEYLPQQVNSYRVVY